MDVRLPDGTVLKNVPDGTTKEQLMQKLQANGYDTSKLQPEQPSLGRRVLEQQAAPAEIATSIGSGIVANAAGGIAGMARGAGAGAAALASGKGWQGAREAFAEEGSETVEGVREAMTYVPRGQDARKAVELISKPFELLARAGDRVGAAAADITGSPAVGAAVNTTIQALPGILAPEMLGKGPMVRAIRARNMARAAGKARVEPTISEPPQTPSQGQGQPAGAAQAPGAPQTPPPGTAPQGAPAASAAQKAEAYARTRAGLDWDRLSDSFKKTLTTIAAESGGLDRLDPAAVARQGKLQSLRIPTTTTTGRLTRDPVQSRLEANVAATRAGEPIRNVDVESNRAIAKNIRLLAEKARGQGKSRATAQTAEQVGEAVQDLALRAKEKLSVERYTELYKKARETEPDAEVNPAPMYEFLTKNPEVQHLNWLSGWLKKAKIEIPEDASAAVKEGEPTSVTMRGVKLEELDDLRKKAVGIAQGGGTDGFYASQVIKAIDKSFEEIPDAAKAWKAAREAFKEHKIEFEDQAAVARQVENKSRTDRATALEDTWKKAIGTAKIEEIRQLKRSLLSGGSEETRLAGKQAIRELRAETIRQIEQRITKGVTTNQAGERVITADALNRALQSIGRDRLNEILGRQTTRELYDILEAAEIAKTEPAIRRIGSDTMQNLLNFFEKFGAVGELLGPVAGAVYKGGKVVKDAVADVKVGRAATRDPLEQAAKQSTKRVKKAKSRAVRKEAAKKAAPVAPLTLESTGALDKKEKP